MFYRMIAQNSKDTAMSITPTTFHAAPLNRDDLLDILDSEGGPCVTILSPMSPMPDELEANRIQFKALMEQAEEALGHSDASPAAVRDIAAALETIADEQMLFRGGAKTLAVFVKPGFVHVHRLLHTTPPAAVLAETFHIKPLIRHAQAMRRYRVLCISRHDVALFEGSGPVLSRVELHDDVPTSMAEAIGGPDQVAQTKREARQPEDSDQKDDQLRRYFQRVAEPLRRHHLHDQKPLVLAALSEQQSLYREAADHPGLIDAGIERDPFHEMDEARLAELALEAIDQTAEDRLDEIKEHIGEAQAHGQAEIELEAIAKSAAHGRVATLYVDHDRRIPGEIDPATGEVTRKPRDDAEAEDVLDDIAQMTLRQSGEVVAFTSEHMPEHADAVAILRY